MEGFIVIVVRVKEYEISTDGILGISVDAKMEEE